MKSPYFFASIMFLAGLGIPTMAALNAGLGLRLQSTLLSTSVFFVVALLTTLIFYACFDSAALSKLFGSDMGRAVRWYSIPWYFYFGGIFVAYYVLGITWVAPKFGISNAVSFVLLGQLIAMSIIDHYGLLGAQQYVISVQRGVGLILMSIGVLMVVSR